MILRADGEHFLNSSNNFLITNNIEFVCDQSSDKISDICHWSEKEGLKYNSL